MKIKNITEDTPARFIGVRALANHRKALVELLNLLPYRPSSVLDIRYGTGGWAREIVRAFSPVSVVGYEKDAETVREAYRHPSIRILTREWKPSPAKERVDLLLADFTSSSVLNRTALDEAIETVSPSLVIFSDGACGKMKMNYRTYGIAEPSMELYWRQFPIEGYRLLGWAQKHRTVSVGLFERLDNGKRREKK